MGTKRGELQISKIQPSAKEWHDGFTTLIAIVNNIVLNPKNLKYRKVQSTNAAFHRKLGRLSGGLDMLVALGFREDAMGALTLEGDDYESISLFLRARLIELQTGLPNIMTHAADETNTVNAAAALQKKAKSKTMGGVKNRGQAGAGSQKVSVNSYFMSLVK